MSTNKNILFLRSPEGQAVNSLIDQVRELQETVRRLEGVVNAYNMVVHECFFCHQFFKDTRMIGLKPCGLNSASPDGILFHDSPAVFYCWEHLEQAIEHDRAGLERPDILPTIAYWLEAYSQYHIGIKDREKTLIYFRLLASKVTGPDLIQAVEEPKEYIHPKYKNL